MPMKRMAQGGAQGGPIQGWVVVVVVVSRGGGCVVVITDWRVTEGVVSISHATIWDWGETVMPRVRWVVWWLW